MAKGKRNNPFTNPNPNPANTKKKARQTVITFPQNIQDDGGFINAGSEEILSLEVVVPDSKTPMEFKAQTIAGVSLEFPYRPYPCQLQVMSKLIKCCNDGVNGIFESPTGSLLIRRSNPKIIVGTGKTLSILVSAISWQNKEKIVVADALAKQKLAATSKIGNDEKVKANPFFQTTFPTPLEKTGEKDPPRVPKIFIASRTQRQLEQMIRELKVKTKLNPKMAILGSRDHLCIHQDVLAKPNRNEECSARLDTKNTDLNCHFYDNNMLLASLKRQENVVFDIEDLVTDGKRQGACPYFAAKSLAETADVIFAPYNYFIDPRIRESASIDLTDNILIVDEAHNIEGCATDAASLELSETDLIIAMDDINLYCSFTKSNGSNLISLIKVFTTLLTRHRTENLALSENEKSLKIWNGPEACVILREGGLDRNRLSRAKSDLTEYSAADPNKDNAKLNLNTKSTVGTLITVMEFLFTKEFEIDYRMVISRQKTRVYNARQAVQDQEMRLEMYIEFWCLNSGVIFKDIGSKCRSVILTSGTMSPITSYSLELGIPFGQTVEAHHVISSDQIWAGVVPIGKSGQTMSNTFGNLSQPYFQDELGRTITSLASKIPAGVLVFVPSYSWLGKFVDRWQKNGIYDEMSAIKTVFVEQNGKGGSGSGSSGANLEKMISAYNLASSSDKGALMFCVYRGKMSEGIDFADNKARAVICIGIPYPNVKSLKINESKNYHNRYSVMKNIMDGATWYKTQAFRALNQALGRCIRHQNDYGAVILLESRFSSDPHLYKMLPKWFQKFLAGHSTFSDVEQSLTDFFVRASLQDQERKAAMKKEPSSPDIVLVDEPTENTLPDSSKSNIVVIDESDDSLKAKQMNDIPCSSSDIVECKDDAKAPDTLFKSSSGGEDPALPPFPRPELDHILVPESPVSEVVKGHFQWSCASCAFHLMDSSEMSICKEALDYPTSLLVASGELCDAGIKTAQVSSGLKMDETDTIFCSVDGITYNKLSCNSCEARIGLLIVACQNKFVNLADHVLLFTDSVTFSGSFMEEKGEDVIVQESLSQGYEESQDLTLLLPLTDRSSSFENIDIVPQLDWDKIDSMV